jgi:MraZ protein
VHSVAQLYGEHHYQMDPKGRISLPGKFREALEEGLTVTLGRGGCLAAFPHQEWAEEARRVEELTAEARGNPEYRRVLFGNAEQVELDKQGRLVVPVRLRQKTRLERDVTVVGVGGHLEIWDAEAYRRRQEIAEARFSAGELLPQL